VDDGVAMYAWVVLSLLCSVLAEPAAEEDGEGDVDGGERVVVVGERLVRMISGPCEKRDDAYRHSPGFGFRLRAGCGEMDHPCSPYKAVCFSFYSAVCVPVESYRRPSPNAGAICWPRRKIGSIFARHCPPEAVGPIWDNLSDDSGIVTSMMQALPDHENCSARYPSTNPYVCPRVPYAPFVCHPHVIIAIPRAPGSLQDLAGSR